MIVDIYNMHINEINILTIQSKRKRSKTKNILISKESYEDSTIYYTRSAHKNSIKNIKEKIYTLNKSLDRIKERISSEKLEQTRVFSDVDINVVILMTCVIKYDDEFYLEIFLEVALYV